MSANLLRDSLGEREGHWCEPWRGVVAVLLPTRWTPSPCVSPTAHQLQRRRRLPGLVRLHTCSAQRYALFTLDRVAATASLDVAARALAVQAELLWAIAGWGGRHGEVRPGPASHKDWLPALRLIAQASAGSDHMARAVPMLGKVRDKVCPTRARSVLRAPGYRALQHLTCERRRVLTQPPHARPARLGTRDPCQWCLRDWHRVGRTARHYFHASQVLIARCFGSAAPPPPVEPAAAAPPTTAVDATGQTTAGAWYRATAPARVDLAGGWTDTPPITFEASGGVTGGDGGGLVVNAAVTVDGVRPIGCRARVTTDGTIVVRRRLGPPTPSAPGDGSVAASAAAIAASGAPAGDAAASGTVREVQLRTLQDLADHGVPGSSVSGWRAQAASACLLAPSLVWRGAALHLTRCDVPLLLCGGGAVRTGCHCQVRSPVLGPRAAGPSRQRASHDGRARRARRFDAWHQHACGAAARPAGGQVRGRLGGGDVVDTSRGHRTRHQQHSSWHRPGGCLGGSRAYTVTASAHRHGAAC